jgi:hypothetical protein
MNLRKEPQHAALLFGYPELIIEFPHSGNTPVRNPE